MCTLKVTVELYIEDLRLQSSLPGATELSVVAFIINWNWHTTRSDADIQTLHMVHWSLWRFPLFGV